jgi:hypothetical protein
VERVPADTPVVGQAELSTITGQKLTVPLVAIDVESPFFRGKVHAAVVRGTPSPLLISNSVVFHDGTEQSVPVCAQGQFVSSAFQTNITEQPKSQSQAVKVAIPGSIITVDQVRKFQHVDKSLRKHIATAKAQSSYCQHGSYFVHEGLLYRQFSPNKHVNLAQLVIPSGLRPEVLRLAHDHTPAGAMGIRKTANQLLQSFYWPGMKNDIRRYRRIRNP